MLRFDAPIQSRARVSREALQLGERVIRADRVVVLLIGAANRDPDAFPSPEEFSLDRLSNAHLSFGVGPHFCLGAVLARVEATAAFTLLLRMGFTRPASSAPLRDTSNVFRGYSSVPVLLNAVTERA